MMQSFLIVRPRAIVALAPVAIGATSLLSQTPTPPSPFATVTGIAVDSLHGGYLRNAVVRVNGTPRASVTDSLGRFRIDSIPPGAHVIELIHPLLDTLGLAIKTQPISFEAAKTARVALATPSPSTVIATKCTAAERQVGPAAAIGMVLGADTDMPAAGAHVSLDWTDIESVAKQFQRSPKKRIAAVQSDGSFRICGLPEDFGANAVAYREKDSTSVVGVRFSPLLAIVTLFLPEANATVGSASPRPSGILRGKIVNGDGAPIARARIAVENDTLVALTNQEGGFNLDGITTGTRSVSVRALGFEPTETVLAIRAGAPAQLDLKLAKFVPVLNSVIVSAKRDASLERVGFTERKASASGKFFTPADLEQRNPLKLNYLLEAVTTLRTRRTASGQSYVTGRDNTCVTYFVDGARWATPARMDPDDPDSSSPNAFVSGGELAAVEVYDALSAPPEFATQGFNGQSCAAVVIWTKSKLRL
jgi:hypothetical protein